MWRNFFSTVETNSDIVCHIFLYIFQSLWYHQRLTADKAKYNCSISWSLTSFFLFSLNLRSAVRSVFNSTLSTQKGCIWWKFLNVIMKLFIGDGLKKSAEGCNMRHQQSILCSVLQLFWAPSSKANVEDYARLLWNMGKEGKHFHVNLNVTCSVNFSSAGSQLRIDTKMVDEAK